MLLNVPNTLTILRMLLVPCIVFALLRESYGIALGIFLFAGVSDGLDGFIARRFNQCTPLGALLDPLADKLLVCAAMIMLIPVHRVPGWMVVIVVAREIGVTALRGVASTEGVVIAASSLGKAKTLLLNIGTAALILHYPVAGIDAHKVGMWFLVPGLVLTAWSGLDYFFRFVGEIFKR